MHFPPVRPAGVIDSRRSTRCYIGQYSRDGSLLATAYQDAHIRIFDVRKCAFPAPDPVCVVMLAAILDGQGTANV